MLRLVIFLSILLVATYAKEQEINSTTTIKTDSESTTQSSTTSNLDVTSTVSEINLSTSTTEKAEDQSTSTESINSIEDNSHESSEEQNENPLVPLSTSTLPARRKVLYINQQQSGKLNVHLELNDVSLIVIPNKKDPQLSLLNLLLRSAQKSNLKNNEEKKKEENAKASVQHHDVDDYSQKYKMDNYMHASTVEPTIESRAPYRVDISSTLSQSPPVVDITNNGKFQAQAEFARSPMVKLMKPIPLHPHGHAIFKRSIDTSFLRFNPEVLDDISISQNNSDEEQQELINSLENNSNQNLNGLEKHEDLDNGQEFVLLGATENCGPGRRRNSYQICVAIEE